MFVQGSDLVELRRHAYSNSVDPYTIKQMVRKVFPQCRCKELKQEDKTKHLESDGEDLITCTDLEPSSTAQGGSSSMSGIGMPVPLHDQSRWCAGHEVAIDIESTVKVLDAREECLATLLCYLELQGWIEVMNPILDTCSLKCYGGSRQLRALARKVPAVAAAVARLREQGEAIQYFMDCSW